MIGAMIRCRRLGGILLICCFLAGCAPKFPVLTPALQGQLLQDVVKGQAVLDCELSCSWAWISAQPELRRLHDVGDWSNLGIRVAQIGEQRDLGYYYLGRAAEGLGAYGAATRYYRIAGAIATGIGRPQKCATTNLCAGFVFPRDVQTRLYAMQTMLQPVSPARAATGSRTSRPARGAAPVAGPSVAPAADPEWVLPPPVVR